jgi:hypothetical protein
MAPFTGCRERLNDSLVPSWSILYDTLGFPNRVLMQFNQAIELMDPESEPNRPPNLADPI